MTDAKHTPGPWRAFIDLPSKTIAVHAGESDRNETAIVAWSGFDATSRPIKEQAANARLIAAAPDMLEALKKLDEVQAFSTPLPDDGAVSDLQDAFNAARAAIAKTEGRS